MCLSIYPPVNIEISPKNIPNSKEAVAVQFLGCPAPPPVLQSRTSTIFFLCIKFRRMGLFPLTQQPGSGRLAIRSPDQKMVSENEVDPTRGNSWGTWWQITGFWGIPFQTNPNSSGMTGVSPSDNEHPVYPCTFANSGFFWLLAGIWGCMVVRRYS